MTRVTMTLAFVLLSLSTMATANDDVLDRLAKPLEKDQIFYRWQSTTSGENLVREGVMTPELDRHFMGMTDNIAAGPGLYLADSEFSSSGYLPEKGGNLVEVHLPKGTRVVDVTDDAQMKAFADAGLNLDALKSGKSLNGSYVLRYTEDWFVGKNMAGQARFEMYPGRAQSPERVAWMMNFTEQQTHVARARAQVSRQIMNLPAERRKELFAGDPLSPFYLSTLDQKEIGAVIETALAHELPMTYFRHLLTHFASDAGAVSRFVKDDPARAARLADAMAERAHPDVLDLSRDHAAALVKIAKIGAPNDPLRHQRLLHLVDGILSPYNLTTRLNESRARVIPLLRQLDLTNEERARVAARLSVVFSSPDLHQNQAGELKKMAEASGIDDARFATKLDALATRKDRLKRAVAGRSVEDVVAGLREHEGFTNFYNAYRMIAARVPNEMMDKAYEIYVKRHAAEYADLFRSGDHLAEAAYHRGTPNGRSFKLMYEAALEMGADARARFLGSCLDHVPCARRLESYVTNDGGKIFAGVTKTERMAGALERLTMSEPKLAQSFGAHVDHPPPALPESAFGRCVQIIEKGFGG